jgi:two-component system, NarL family, sensor kinase
VSLTIRYFLYFGNKYFEIALATFLMIALIISVIVSIVKYQNRTRKHFLEVHNLKNIYQNEILKAQLEMQEQTVRTISQEIHDNIGQILSLIRLNISTIKAEENSPSERKIITSKELLDKAIEDLRDLSKRLNTEYVSQQSLADSLRFQLTLIQRTELYETTLEVHGPERPLEPEKKLIVFRIAQEALNNILKHAEAKNISVLVMYLPGKIILSIKDDGHGFEAAAGQKPDEPVKGIGTTNMHYRANLIGAEFSLQSKPGEGCLAQLILPTA